MYVCVYQDKEDVLTSLQNKLESMHQLKTKALLG